MQRKWLSRLAGALMVAACGSPNSVATMNPTAATPPAGPVTVTPAASPAPTPVIVPNRLDETLTLADGRTIKARCVGEGTPTILLEVGGSNDMGDWAPQFVNALGMETTTCLYSRAGGRGSSEPAERPVSMEDVTSDAFEVLELAKAKSGVEGPYVFVGWSLGGSVALADALTRPDQTVGMGIIDSGLPADFLKNCAADGRTADDCQAEWNEDIDAKFMETEIAEAIHPLDLPAVFAAAMEYPECVDSPSATQSANLSGITVVAGDCAGLAVAIADYQIAAWKAVLPEIEETRFDANHNDMIRSDGQAIAGLILKVVAAARASL
jgi:pimeloyl-ACP methyl ester carboxylesterase